MSTAIIGGGIAGLSVALRLANAGERPIIIEPGEVGGMVRTVLQDGFTCELGPNVLVERPDIVGLIADLKIGGDVAYPSVEPYGQYVWHDGLARKVPAGVLEFLRTPLFSARTKLALPLRVVRAGVLTASGDDASVLDFFSPLIGRDGVQAVLDPVLKGIYGGDAAVLSARTLFPGLWSAAVSGSSVLGYMRSKPKGGKPRIFVLRGGIQKLIHALLTALDGRVEVVREAAVQVSPSGSGYEVLTSGGRRISASSCIVTTAGGATASLIRHIEPDLAEQLAAIDFATLTAIHLAVDRRENLIHNAFGVLCPGGMPENFLGVMFNSLIFPHMAPPDRHLLTVIVGGAQARGETPDVERLKGVIPRLLSEMFGVNGAQWLGSFSWKGAIPQLVVGHHRLIAALDSAEARHPGLAFVGVDRGGVGVSDRIRVAREGLERILRK